MATVSYRETSRIYPGSGHVAADKLDLEIVNGESTALVSPSGYDKSTSFRTFAGLEEVSSGLIFIGDRDVTGLSLRNRDVAMVSQNYTFYPYMTIADNMGFASKMQSVLKAEREKRIKEVTHPLGLEDFLSRRPKTFSGGQWQRVAVGRAIVCRPQVFLMDELLSNFDAKLRVSTRTRIAALQRCFGVTTAYVTHDQVEAITIRDRVAVIKDGALQQVDSPLALYDAPKNLFVAGFIGSPAVNLVESTAVDGGVQIDDYVVPVAREVLAKTGGEATLTLGIRPESFRITADEQGISLDIVVVERLGTDSCPCGTLAGLSEDELVGTQQIVTRIGARQVPAKGDIMRLAADPESMHVFSNATQEHISRNA